MACNDYGLKRKSVSELRSLLQRSGIRNRKAIEKAIRQIEGQSEQLQRNGGKRPRIAAS